jgi:nicotinate-nucleotide pyrophosphorylase
MYESPQVKTLIRAALEEDLGLGDITCALTILSRRGGGAGTAGFLRGGDYARSVFRDGL